MPNRPCNVRGIWDVTCDAATIWVSNNGKKKEATAPLSTGLMH